MEGVASLQSALEASTGSKDGEKKAIQPVNGDRSCSESDRTYTKRRGSRYPPRELFQKTVEDTEKSERLVAVRVTLPLFFSSLDRPLLFMAQADNTSTA